MATDKDISSTEKLLDVIRKGSKDTVPEQSAAVDTTVQTGKNLSGPGEKLISIGSRDIIGIEIWKHGLSIVKMSRRGSTWKASQAFSLPMKKDLTPESPDFPSFLRESLQTIDKINKARIWVMIPAFKGEIWQVNVPRVKKDVYNAVYWSAKKEKSFDESTSFFDYRILGEVTDKGAKKLTAEVFIAPRNEINLLKKIFSNAGFALEGITLTSFALQNLFITKRVDSRNEPFAVLSIGQDYSYIDMYMEDRMLLSRVIKTGLGSMVEAIIDELASEGSLEMGPENQIDSSADLRPSPDREKAVHLLARLAGGGPGTGKQGEDYSTEKIYSMIAPALERLARQVERTIDHSVNVQNNPSPTSIYICGTLASSSRFISFFQEQLGLTVQALDPLNPAMPNVSLSVSSLKKDERLSMVPATGLAMSSNEYTPNFLYTALDRENQRIQKRIGVLAAAAIMLAVLIAGGFYYQSYQELLQARHKVESLSHRLEAKSPHVSQEMISSMAGSFSQKSSLLRSYSEKFVPMAAMSEITAITPANIQLLNVRLDMGHSVASDRSSQAKIMVIDGFIKGDEVLFETYLSSYLFRIRSSRLFGDTEIHKSSAEEFGTEGQVLRFILNVNLRQV